MPLRFSSISLAIVCLLVAYDAYAQSYSLVSESFDTTRQVTVCTYRSTLGDDHTVEERIGRDKCPSTHVEFATASASDANDTYNVATERNERLRGFGEALSRGIATNREQKRVWIDDCMAQASEQPTINWAQEADMALEACEAAYKVARRGRSSYEVGEAFDERLERERERARRRER